MDTGGTCMSQSKITVRKNNLEILNEEANKEKARLCINTLITAVILTSLIAIPDFFLMGLFLCTSSLSLYSWHRLLRKQEDMDREKEIINYIHRKEEM
jgi:hypothetical protein